MLMCGLIGMFNFATINKKTKKKTKIEPVNTEVINQLQDQIGRGNEGFGILMIDKKNEIELKRATEISKALLDLYMTESPMIMMHHRNPTSSENKISQTHPIVVSDGSLKYDYYVIHNGMISNTDELKKKHEKLGFLYNTIRKDSFNREEYNDSESLAIEMAMYIEKQIKEISIEGSAAFIIVQTDKKTKKATNIFFGRKDNPLKLSGRQGEIRLSSEGKGKNILEETLYKFNIKSPALTKTNLNFKEEVVTNYSFRKDYYQNKNETDITTRKGIESGSSSDTIKKEIEDIEEDTIVENDLEKISEEFITSTADMIEQFATKIADLTEISQIDIESEKKDLAIDIITNAQKSYNLAIDIAQEHIYDNIEKETKERIEKENKKEEKEEKEEKETKRNKTLMGYDRHEKENYDYEY